MKIPKQYRTINGLYLWCNNHKTAFKDRCPKHGRDCRLTFQSRIWNPNSHKTNIIRSWPTEDIEEAVKLHLEFKRKLKDNNYYLLPEVLKEVKEPTVMRECINRYLDYIVDDGTAEHEKKKLTPKYIEEERRTIDKFLRVLKENGLNPNYCHVQINSQVVGLFHEFLEKNRYSGHSYNNYMRTMKRLYTYFFNNGWVSENPFNRVTNKPIEHDPEIIYEEEISELLKVITPENGWGKKGKDNRQYYKPWLKDAILLGLYSGARPAMVFRIRWKHVLDNFLKVPNEKINRQQKTNTHFEHTFITPDIAEFLASLERGGDDDFLIQPDHTNRDSLRKQASWGFHHFWQKMGGRPGIAFKHLRKTKLTREIALLGDKSKYLSSHKSHAVKVDHYIGQQEIVETMKGKRMFDI